MLVKKAPDIKSSEITNKKLYLNRRQFIAGTGALFTLAVVNSSLLQVSNIEKREKLKVRKRGEFKVTEKVTPYEEATSYTNFYEFSTGKRSVKDLSKDFKTRPWTLSVEGYVKKPKTYDVDELIHMFPLVL